MAQNQDVRLRARHDAGRPGLPWRRFLLPFGALAATGGLAVVGAGALRTGPLATIGWSEQSFTPQSVVLAAPRDRATELQIGFGWKRPEFCSDDFKVALDERADKVVVRSVQSRVPRFSFGAPRCSQQKSQGGRAYAHVTLHRPLQGRPLVTGGGRPLAVTAG